MPVPPLDPPLAGSGARYFTNITFQGDGLGPTVGIWADEDVYAEGTHSNFLICFVRIDLVLAHCRCSTACAVLAFLLHTILKLHS
jgi:hypothetical protein